MAKHKPSSKFHNNELSDEFLTVSKFKREEIKVKGSHFIASMNCAESRTQAEEFLIKISKEFYDATHNCYAYRVGMGKGLIERYGDQGEPSGTAGLPILNAIKSKELTNTIVVVTRYFGGTKLGTGNLARAYNSAAEKVLSNSEIITKIIRKEIRLTAPAEMVSIIYHNTHSFGGKIIVENYNPNGDYVISLRLSKIKSFKEQIIEATNGKAKFIE